MTNLFSGKQFRYAILNFQVSRGSVATQLWWGGNLYRSYIESFLENMSMKELWKLVFIRRSYDQQSRGCFYWNTVCMLIQAGEGVEGILNTGHSPMFYNSTWVRSTEVGLTKELVLGLVLQCRSGADVRANVLHSVWSDSLTDLSRQRACLLIFGVLYCIAFFTVSHVKITISSFNWSTCIRCTPTASCSRFKPTVQDFLDPLFPPPSLPLSSLPFSSFLIPFSSLLIFSYVNCKSNYWIWKP